MNKERKLTNTTIVLLVVVALFYDVIQALFNLIPILGQFLSSIIGLFAFLTFFVWLKTYGIKFSSNRRGVYMGGGFLIEMIPILNMLPAWTLAIVLIVLDIKAKQALSNITPGHKEANGDVVDINEYRRRKSVDNDQNREAA